MRKTGTIQRDESMVGSWVLILSLFSLLIAFSFTSDLPVDQQAVVMRSQGLDQGNIVLAEEAACRDGGGVNCACQGRIAGYIQYEGAMPRPYLTMSAADRQQLARSQSAHSCDDRTGQLF